MVDLTAAARVQMLVPGANPVRTRADWETMRAQVLADPGAFHGRIAAQNLHWLVDVAGRPAWLSRGADGEWTGWDAETAAPVAADLPADFAPWTRAFNADDAPNFRWFEGGRTNAAFNELDRHVLAGHGAEAAFIFEGDRWDLAANNGRGAPVDCVTVSRRLLLLEAAKCAVALQKLGLKAGDRIALNMPNVPAQLYWTEAAKRIGVIYTPVFGGFSDKTLSDRIHDAGARIVITADGGYRNAQIVPFKTAYTDPALDNYVPVNVALRMLEDRLGGADLGLSDSTRTAMAGIVTAALKGEVTVERGDVMRGLGRALAELGKEGLVDAAQSARIRIAIAETLVSTPPRVDAVIVANHAHVPDIVWRDRDVWGHDLTNVALADILAAAGLPDEAALHALDDQAFVSALWKASKPLPVDAEYPLFFIYTSGSTGKPKGVVHVHGGYASGIMETMKVAFDARPGDTIFVVADPGWITGQSYMIAAALLSRVTTVLAEGSPVFPHAGRFAAMIENHGVTIFKAGVTFLKAVMTDPQNLKDIQAYDLSEVARSYDRVQEERRDLARAQYRGDPRDIREESRELYRAQREFRQDRADLYRAGWDDDRRRDGWDDDDRRRGQKNGRGWGPGGRPANDWRYRQDGWNRQGWHAEQFYRPGNNYQPRYLGANDQIWRGYDNRYYCRRSDGTTGLIIGGLTGGTLGNVLAPGGSKVLGSIIGGTLGAVIGNSVDRNRVVCR